MSRPLPKNLVASRELRARRNRIRTDYIRNLREESENEVNESAEPLKVPKFTIPEIPKIEKLQATYTSPVVEEQNNTLDDFEREYQAFIEKLKKEKEKKELKEELKTFCKEYINEILGINQPQEEPEPVVEEPEDIVVDEPLFADVDEEPKSMEEEYQDFINSLKQRKKENNNE